jgi:hypothetical protein
LAAFIAQQFYVGDLKVPFFRRYALYQAAQWALVKPFPVTAGDADVEIKGTGFTHSFEVYFSAPASTVSAWLEQSPGAKQRRPKILKNGFIEYRVDPGSAKDIVGTIDISPDGTHVHMGVGTYVGGSGC